MCQSRGPPSPSRADRTIHRGSNYREQLSTQLWGWCRKGSGGSSEEGSWRRWPSEDEQDGRSESPRPSEAGGAVAARDPGAEARRWVGGPCGWTGLDREGCWDTDRRLKPQKSVVSVLVGRSLDPGARGLWGGWCTRGGVGGLCSQPPF